MVSKNKLECLHMAITFQSGLTFAGNTQEDKPSSLLALIISDEGKNIYNIDTRSDALPDLCRHISENKMNFTFCIFTVYINVTVSTFLFFYLTRSSLLLESLVHQVLKFLSVFSFLEVRWCPGQEWKGRRKIRSIWKSGKVQLWKWIELY